MAKHLIDPADLTAAHIGQYVRVSTKSPMDGGAERETLLVGALLGVEHKLDEIVEKALQTRITVDVAVNEVVLFIPPHIPVEIAETVDELMAKADELAPSE
ncbi:MULTISPECIES: hypothetical protein [Rhodococcus]|uniref:Uncharacterized protein n=1 Tax=Rhodococcus oxybenzonivorans TaxID=1990687 RepID=A0AAE4UVC1_9NOCA|nr:MULTISPECIES: hypothetical protein [Rhodococcus]MDV7245511.1 hypothetical protein [Rhodococcus oxybenzonivorans]MDV7263312.1 hypothetical protein [Rhodococcus oxybenzonivorans]MDV7276591.1 hypothetical protein [Rhodococcus oxybenzonivorans]MDV7336482.1 hypothetical protein [Rhodococcus oxybenzonivorans]MDV7346813.1 hypothetical protein [Rhodococcus oxybenzonivorans]